MGVQVGSTMPNVRWGWHGQPGLQSQGSEPSMAECPLVLGCHPRVQAGLLVAGSSCLLSPSTGIFAALREPHVTAAFLPGAICFPLCTNQQRCSCS